MQNGINSSPTQSERSAYWTVKDAANYLGVSRYCIYTWFLRGQGPPHLKIRVTKNGRPMIRIPKKSFLAWVKQNEV